MGRQRGIVAAGHEVTAGVASEILHDGGNAFDAVLGALFASCIAEPVLASLGGGGFLLARKPSAPPRLYDFFTQTPRNKPVLESIDFHPILADFGAATQEFHIGLGAMATPGVVKGIFEIHRRLCSMPLQTIIQPACEAARSGIRINRFQHYISEIIAPIIKSSPDALRLHTPDHGADIAREGDRVRHPEMADTFEALAQEGEALFYQGEIARRLLRDTQANGGCLHAEDLDNYRVMLRAPLSLDYHRASIFTNPAPSVGGTLIAFTLALLQPEKLGGWRPGSHPHLYRVARAQQLTQMLRREQGIDLQLDEETSREILGEEYLQAYRKSMQNHHFFPRGTTQISIADRTGNLASMTLSNGEGAGYVIPGTGIMMNNMLGEEDINPYGFHLWPTDRRIASMMSPTLVHTTDGHSIVTGSGGSNRIRSAILQVLINLIDFNMCAEMAVEQPRLHFENDLLNIETGITESELSALADTYSTLKVWPEKNLFFGGAHTVMLSRDGVMSGQGDSRRGGVCILV